MARRHGLYADLKRRNVLRALALYIGAVWALAQGVAQLTPALGLPDWTTRGFLIACVVGFPFWTAFAWFYEFTPQGFRRDSEIAQDATTRHASARKLDFAIIGVLVVAVALLASGYFLRGNAPMTKTAAFKPPADSIVVLPLKNLSADKQQYFSDGITEELTGALGQNTGLTVIAWETASKFADSDETPQQIGKALNVAHILGGSIQREGDEVRVSVELVSTISGRQLWSKHYDDSLKNIFAVQDRITGSIAGALQVKFAAANTPRTVNPEAYDLVLKARALTKKGLTAAPFEQARRLLQQAIALDPDDADAHAVLARVWFDLTQVSTLSFEDALPKVREEANRALALNPRNVDALVALGNAGIAEINPARAKTEFERALAIDPSDAAAHLDYGNVLPPQQALTQYQKAVRLDPENATAQNNFEVAYQNLGQYRQALAPSLALTRLAPHSADAAFGVALTYALLRRDEDAAKAFDRVQPDTELGRALVAAGRLAYRSMLDSKLRPQALAAVDTLHKRPDIDPTSMYDMIQLYLVLGRNDTALGLLPKFCASIPVGCNNLSVYPTWLPLHGDPRFEALVKKYDTTSQPPASAASAPSSP